ncbi:hypothetical protein [Riemerella anatipestifer]|uniref:hypothetical protein n=1 Tax=Riemerella anatipestifer TaxID=34085 RepID=UPI0023648C08|nr:hypothetical protein [Riemerella anatipestifer]
MNKIIELSYKELLITEGGCKGCRSTGKRIGQAVQETLVWEALESAYQEVKSWFD